MHAQQNSQGATEQTENLSPQESKLRELASRLPELESAIADNPNDAGAMGNYAQALFQLGNLPAAWEHLIKGYQVNPGHTGINRGLPQVVAAWKQQGVFNVGVEEATLIHVLGKPQHDRAMPRGKRLVYAYLAIDLREGRIHEIIDLRGATERLFQPTEIIDVQLDGRSWSVGVREKNAKSSSAQYFLPSETLANWSEIFQIERILDGASIGTMQQITQAAIDQITSLKQESKAQVTIIESDANSSIVAFEDFGPVGRPKVHQLVRFFRGPVDVHRITLRVKSETPPSIDLQMKWLQIFRAAELKPVSQE